MHNQSYNDRVGVKKVMLQNIRLQNPLAVEQVRWWRSLTVLVSNLILFTFKDQSFRALKSMKEEGSPSSTNPSCNVLRIQTQIIALISNPKANKSNSMHATLYLMEHQVSLASGVRKGWLFRWPWWKLWRTWRLQLTIVSSSSHWERRTERKKRKTNACRLLPIYQIGLNENRTQ